jgi:hypothetical protein
VTNNGSSTINVAFNFFSNGTTTEKAGASYVAGDAATTPYGADILAGETKEITFDLANPVVSSWSLPADCNGTMVGNQCVVASSLKVEAISGIEWSINELLDESPWNGPLSGTSVEFDNYIVGDFT